MGLGYGDRAARRAEAEQMPFLVLPVGCGQYKQTGQKAVVYTNGSWLYLQTTPEFYFSQEVFFLLGLSVWFCFYQKPQKGQIYPAWPVPTTSAL